MAVPLEVLSADRNVGERTNVNRVLRRIRPEADWVLLLHSDDVAKPSWLRLMLDRISGCEASVASICSSWDDWMPDGSVIPGEDDPERPIEIIRGDRAAVRDTLRRGCWWHISGCAVRLRAFDDVGEFEQRMPQLGDWEWLLRCLARGWSVEYIPRTLIRYRQHEASVSALSFRTDHDIRESLEIIERHAPVLDTRDVLALHGKRMRSCARRLVRAVLRVDTRRAALVLQTWWRVAASLVRILAAGREATRSRPKEAGA